MTLPNKVVQTEHGPLIINDLDAYIGTWIKEKGYWQEPEIFSMSSLITLLLSQKPKITFYDVGANIGTHSMALAKRFGDRINVRAFEAQRHIYYMLCGNISMNGLDNVICHHAAVSDVSGQVLQVQMPDYNKVNNLGGLELIEVIKSDNAAMFKAQVEPVSTVTLDQYNEHIDFLKLDVEGMEYQALLGGNTVITRSRPVCFVEMDKSDVAQIKKFFGKLRYRAYSDKLLDWYFCPVESDVFIKDTPEIIL